MNLKNFGKMIDEFYAELKSIADEAVGGFAIDSMHPPIDRKKKKKPNPLEEKNEKNFKRVMIDFDKTIYPYKKGWNDGRLDGPPYPDAKRSIEKLKNRGYEIVIFSTRVSTGNAGEMNQDPDEQVENIKNYLVNYGIYFDRITGDKIAADFYIDDKAVQIKNGNWNDVLSQIQKREESL